MTPICGCKEPKIVANSDGNIYCSNCGDWYSVKHGSVPVTNSNTREDITKAKEAPSEPKATATCKRCHGTGKERAGMHSKRKKQCRCIGEAAKRRVAEQHERDMKRSYYGG